MRIPFGQNASNTAHLGDHGMNVRTHPESYRAHAPGILPDNVRIRHSILHAWAQYSCRNHSGCHALVGMPEVKHPCRTLPAQSSHDMIMPNDEEITWTAQTPVACPGQEEYSAASDKFAEM